MDEKDKICIGFVIVIFILFGLPGLMVALIGAIIIGILLLLFMGLCSIDEYNKENDE